MGEVVEDIVKMLRPRFESVSFIIPGWAKSAGTILAMSGDEILMEPASALGPIDAQISWKGKVFSAEAFLEGLEDMKREATDTGILNRAHIPILQQISPGEIQHARNALSFAKELVTAWLRDYKFQDWDVHTSSGAPVTQQERETRAREIADELCKHQEWLSHGRSIKISDLTAIGLKITDYSTDTELHDALTRYHTLLQMTFSSNVYKVFETPTSQIMRWVNVGAQAVPIPGPPDLKNAKDLDANVECPTCKHPLQLQMKFDKAVPSKPGRLQYPRNDRAACSKCGAEINLLPVRQKVEQQAGKTIVRD